MAISVDQMLKKIGEFEKYQWLMICVFGYVGLAIGGFPTLIVTFISAEPDWVCVKGYNRSVCNFTEPITLTSAHYKARCSMPREAWTYVKEFTSTVTEYDLVCEKSLLQSIAQSCYWIGMFLGLISGGYLSDRFGRRKIFYGGIFFVAIATWIMVFPKLFMVFIISRIVIGFGGGFRMGTSFVLLSEYTTEKYRAKMGVASFYFWVISLLMLPLIGYLISEWRYFLLVTAVFGTPCLFFWWFIPESARWLLVHGKEDRARQQLVTVAKINGKIFPNDELENPKLCGQTGNFKHLFKNWKVTRTTLISCNLWFAISLVYYGVSYASVDLGGNRYLNFALASLVEFPANFMAIWSVDKFGRKIPVITGLIIAFIASAIAVSIPADRSNAGYNGGRIFVAVTAKFFITLSFSGVYVWSTELFPTFIRTMGVSTSSAAARIGSFSASYIVWLIRIHPALPFGIMGLICVQAAILALFLPETNGQSTLETLDDMMNDQGNINAMTHLEAGQVIKNENASENASVCQEDVVDSHV